MTKLKTRLPIKALSVFMAILMIFSTMSIMFTVSAAVSDEMGGGNGQWVDTTGTVSLNGNSAYSYWGSATYSNQNVGYAVYLPEDYESYASKGSGNKLATMLVMSGGSEAINTSYYQMANTTGLNYLADKEGIILIYMRQSNTTINSNYYWNWWQPSDYTRDTSSGYIGQKATELVSTIQSRYADYVDVGRTYVTGLSAGAALTATFAALYPDVFAGAAVVAGLPFRTVTDTNTGSNYNSAYNAMDQSGSGYTKDPATLGGYITTAWTAAGRTAENATRVIIFHGSNDSTVVVGNGQTIADANAYARYGANYSQYVTTVESTGYTAKYYNVDEQMLADGYSRDRASDIAFYKIDGVEHVWIADEADGTYSDQSAYIDYNEVMWEFFEGERNYADANPPVTPDGEKTLYASYGAKFCVQNGVSYADLVTAQGLQVTDLPLSNEYLLADTDPTTASQWNFNFDLTEAIDEAKAANLDTLLDVYIKNIKVYQNVWSDITGGSIELSYAVVDSPVISQGGSNATPVASTELLGSWTADYLLDTYQFSAKITDPDDLDELMNYGYLSLVTYGVDGNTAFNVAAPIISIEFGLRERDVDVEVEGDDTTARNSYPVFPVYAYNSAAGYNAATSAANETKVYGDMQGHLTSDAKKYAVGVYNAGDDNDTIYYSYNLADYTKNNGYSVQSITIKYVLEGNPYYSKEDVGVKLSVSGNLYWDYSGDVPADDKLTTVEELTIAKGERVEGEITISFANNEHKSIINYINNLGGFTLAFENTSNNPHYYFLITVPTIIVNYENIPGTSQNAISGIGVRFETGYDDFVADDSLFEKGEVDTSGSTTISSMNADSAYYSSSANSTSSSGFSSATVTNVNATSNYRTVVSSYNIYQAAYEKVIAELEAKYPGAYYSEVEFTVNSATLTLAAKENNSSATGSAYFYTHPSAQSSAISNGSQLTSSNGTQVLTFAPGGTTSVSRSETIDLSSMNFSEDTPYLWIRAHGTSNTSYYSTYYVEVNVPQISDLEISYTATVSMTEPEGGGDEGGGDEGGGDVGGGDVTLGEPYTLTPSTGYYTGTWSNRQSTSASAWSAYTDFSSGYIVGLILNYDLDAAETAIKNEIIAQTIAGIDNYNAQYFDVEVTNFAFGEITATGTLYRNSTTSNTTYRKYVAVVGDTAYNAYNSVFSSASQLTLTQSDYDYTAVLEDFPSGTGQYLTLNYLTGGNTNYSLGDIPEVTVSYTYNVVVTDNTPTEPEPEPDPDPGDEDVLADAAGNTATFEEGDTYKVESDYYTDTRVVTSSTVETQKTTLSKPVDGQIIGTNSKYYTNDMDDYFTGPNRSTGSPVANVAVDTTKTAFPVSLEGYAYVNYDVSSFFNQEKALTLVKEEIGEEEDINGVLTQVTVKTYTETVISSIRINSVRAQEGYTGGWASSYTISGSAWVKAGTKWTSTDRPTSYQALGNADVSSTMGNIGNSANLNDAQFAAAKVNGYVTIWVNNTDCDWYSYYKPSAWMLVNMPTVEVTLKTITYTEKHITETKDRNSQETLYNETEHITTTSSSSVTTAANGYLYGSSTSYYSTSSSYYRTSTTTSTYSYQAQAQTNMTSSSLNNGYFAVTYMGSGFANYNLSSYLTEGKTEVSDGGVITTAIINGKNVEVIKETIEHTETTITGITITATTQAGFTGNNSAANSYNVTNVFYAGAFDTWSGSSYPSKDSSNWQQLGDAVENIRIPQKTVEEELNPEVIELLKETGYLTVRVDNTYNDWSNSYKDCAWTLVSLPDITINYATTTWTETRTTATAPTDEFSPKFEVYAQYRFIDSDGAALSKTKYLGSTEGYGAWGNITPYIVDTANGATLGTVSALYNSPVNPGDTPTNSVVISNSSSDIENYVLKRAYVEDTGDSVALIRPAGDGTYNLYTTIESTEKTNDTYTIRVVFEYECKAEKPVSSDYVTVNLHSIFENFDANGNSQGELGRVTNTAFAALTNGSYVLSLDGTEIPYGNMTVNGQSVSAVSGTNRVYNFNNDRTTITLKNSSGTVVQSTTDADDCTITENNNMAKVYLDMAGDSPSRGDLLVVTYNGDATTTGGTIDVYLYYEATPEYDIDVTYEFDIVDNNGNSITDSKYTYSQTGSYSVGEIIFPYDFLATSEAEVEQFSKVSLAINGVSAEYKVSDFDMSVESSGVTVDDSLKVTAINGANPTVKVKYTLCLDVATNVTVSHVYKLVYGGRYVGSVTLDKTNTELSAIDGGSIPAILDSSPITYPAYGVYTTSQFTPVSITSNNAELVFGSYANGGFAATKVPYNTPNAEVTITYELTVNKLTVNETIKQDGVQVGEIATSAIYVPNNTAYTFTSALTPDIIPNNDGITLEEYTASSTDVTLDKTTGGNVSFTTLTMSADKTVNIEYNYANSAQVPLNVVHQFYKNGVLVGTKTESNVATLTNPGKGTNSYTVTPLSGTVTGISGSISSAIVDASNYYANGMSSTDGNVSVAGYTVTYTNNNATGTQPAIDVVVRYDITDTATVTVNHVYRVNGTVVSANVTNNPTTSLTLTKGVSQTITAAQGTVNYNGTTFDLSKFTKLVSGMSEGLSNSGLAITLDVFNVTSGEVTVYYDLIVREITVTEIFKDSTGTLGTETSTLYVANGDSYTFTSAYSSYDGIAISNFSKTITSGYTLGSGNIATFTATASADATVTITYTVGTQATVTVNHEYYINGTKVTPNVTNTPTTSLTLTKGTAQSITAAAGTVTYNGTTFNLSKFTKLATTSSDGFSTNGLNVTLNAYNAANGTVTVRYDLTVRAITVTEIFKDSTGTLGTETSTLYVADGDSYTFTSAYTSYNGIAIGEFGKSISGGYTVTTANNGAATFTATASADANVTITYTVGTQADVTVNHVYYVNGTEVTGDVTTGTTNVTVGYGSSQTIQRSTGTVNYNGTSFNLGKFTATISATSNGLVANGLNVTLNAYNVASGTVTVRYDLTVREITVKEIFKNSTGTIGEDTSVLYVADGDAYNFTSAYTSYNGIAIGEFSKTISAGYTLGEGDVATFNAFAENDATITITYSIVSQADVTVNHVYYVNGTEVTGSVTTGTTSLTLNYGVAQTITKSTGTVVYNGTSFDLSKFTATVSATSNGLVANGLNVTLNTYNVASGTVTVRYDLTVREITVKEIFKNSTGTIGEDTSVLYVADGDSYTFTSAYASYNGIAIGEFSKTISAGYTLGAGDKATFTSTADGDADVTITYSIVSQADVTVNHVYYVNGTEVTGSVTTGTTSLTLNYGVAQTITKSTGTVVYNGTSFDLSKFTATVSATSNGLVANGLNVTLNAYNVASGTVTVRYDLTVYTINVNEVFVKDGNNVASATKTVYIAAGDDYTFTSDYATGSIIADVALGDYIRTAQGATVTTADNGAATFTVSDIAANTNVTINYAVSAKTIADVEYVYIVNGVEVDANEFADFVPGASTMTLVYGQAVSAPSSTGSYTLTGDSYTLSADFTKTVTVTAGAATATGNDVTLNGYNVADGTVKVKVTYEITISKEADATINHVYYINGTLVTGNVTTGTTALHLVYGESQTINKSTGTVNYNGTEFNLSQFDVTVSYDSDILSMNGLNVELIKYNIGAQTITVRYDLTVYTVVVNQNFYINGVQQTGNTVTNTYYVSAKDAALTAGLVSGSTTVNGIAVSNFITSVSDNSDAIDGAITAGNYVATVNGDGIVTIEYNVSTKTNVNITSIFKVNGSTEGVDISNVTNATATQTGFEYGVSTPVTSLAEGYVIWNGTQFNVSDFTATITNYDVTTISASGLNVTVNKYNTDATNVEITYEITVRSITVTENFIVDGETIETQVTTKYYPYNPDSTYTFTSDYGNSYVPAEGSNTIALSNFVPYANVAGITKNGDGCVEFTVSAADNATATIDYKVTTVAPVVTITHKYFFNGEEITPVITSEGATQISLVYGVSTPITLAQGTYDFNGTIFELSGADVVVEVTSEANVGVDGTNVTLNSYNPTAIELTVNYYLTTVVVNITEVVTTDDGAHTLTLGTHTFYLLDGEVFTSFTSTFDTVKVNGVTIPYTLFTRTVTGADSFNVVETDSAITISGVNAGQGADITITYSGVKTTGTLRIAEIYGYKNGPTTNMIFPTNNPDYSAYVVVNVGDRIALNPDKDITLTVSNVVQTINSTYFYVGAIESTGFQGYVDEETNEFVITSIEPNASGIIDDILVKWCVDLYDDITVTHEFYVNNKLVTSQNVVATNVPIAGTTTTSSKYVIALLTSGTVTDANGKSYNISEFTIDDALIQTNGLTIRRGTTNALKNKYGVQTFDFTVEDKTVVIRYDLTTTLEDADITVNSHYVNNGEYVGSLSSSTVTNLALGDVIANDTVKTINGIEVTFAVESVVGNGVTITEENGVYTITEIDPNATEWSIDITYVATATANVKLTHNFYVAGKLLGTITDNTVIVNLANHSGKFVALNGIVGVTTDKGIVFVNANRFTVTLASGSEYGTFANDIFTLNADALNGSTYEIAFDYNVDGISYALDGEVGIKQTASAIDADGQYNVVTTVTSIGNTQPIDIIFVVDISAGAGDISNEQLTDAKAEIAEYITNSFAVNNSVRVAIVTYADGYEVLAGGYITDKDAALAAVEGITLAETKDGYDVTASNLQAGLYGARMLMNSDVRRAYTDVIVFKGSEPNAAYSQYNDSYNYSEQIAATSDEANAAADYELEKMNASKEIVIDLTNAETNVDTTMTEIFDERNYINVNGKVYITINSDEFTFVEANGVTVNGNAVAYTYETGVLVVELGTLKGTNEIEYTLELTNKVEGDYFVSDEIKVTYTDSVDNAVETRYGVSARVNYNTTTTGATITVIPYYANSDLNPVGMDGLTVKNFYEDAIIGEPVVYAISGVTNLTAGNTYTVKAPVVAGYSLWDNEQSTKTVEIPAEGDNTVVYFGYYADGSLVDDSIVYDDASAIVFDVLSNDTRPTGETFDFIYGIGATESEARDGNREKVSTSYGDLIIIDGGKVRYTPSGITVTGEFYYAVQEGDEIRVAKIYVVPATIVKVDSSDNTQLDVGDRWQVMDNDGNIVDRETNDYVSNKNPNDTDDIYGGYEDNYSNNFLFDGGDSLYSNRYSDYVANGNVDGTDAQYTSTFTFTGTGFDIISVTGRLCGYVTIKTWDSAGNIVSKASGNISTFALTENIYQATIFTCTDLTLDTYTVEVIAMRTYLPRIGMTDTQVYVDSVRTYNPFADNTNEHYNELHNGATTEILKNIFVDGNLAVDTDGNGLFTQTGLLDINSYMNKGTNNAINIISGQSLLFKLDEATARTTFQVEMAAVNSSATVEVYVNSKLVETLNVDTGVYAYYDFSSYIREDSTVKFNVVGGEVTFSKVRYNYAVLGEPEGEKYTTADLTNGTAPDGQIMSEDYTVNTARLVKTYGTSRTISALVYTSTNADSVIIYAGGYRIAPTSISGKPNASGTQNLYVVTFEIPETDPSGEVIDGEIQIDFYAYDSANNLYSSSCRSANYTLTK